MELSNRRLKLPTTGKLYENMKTSVLWQAAGDDDCRKLEIFLQMRLKIKNEKLLTTSKKQSLKTRKMDFFLEIQKAKKRGKMKSKMYQKIWIFWNRFESL